jgi:NitT/TauT family transport system substrate-binding protein
LLRPPGFIARPARPRPAHPAHAFWPAASLLAVCLSAASLTAACGTGAAAPRPGAHRLEKTHLNVLAQQVVDDAPFWIALRDGFFRAAGLSMTVKPLAKTPLGIQALKTGQADVLVGGNFPTMLEDDASGVLKVRILVEGYQGGPDVMDVLTLPDSHITDAAGLAHRSVAVNLTNGIQTLTLNRVLSAEGVNAATVDYKVIPFPAMAAALKNHQVDAIDVLEPFLTQAELSDGAFPVVDQLTGPTEALPISGTFTTDAFVRRYPRTAAAFQRAMLKAQALADVNRAVVETVLPTYIATVTPAVAALINLGTYPTVLDPVPLQRVADLLFGSHLLTHPLNVASLLFR